MAAAGDVLNSRVTAACARAGSRKDGARTTTVFLPLPLAWLCCVGGWVRVGGVVG